MRRYPHPLQERRSKNGRACYSERQLHLSSWDASIYSSISGMVALYVVFRDRFIYPRALKRTGLKSIHFIILLTLFVTYWLILVSWLVRWVWLNWRKYSVKTINLYVLESYCTLTPLFCNVSSQVYFVSDMNMDVVIPTWLGDFFSSNSAGSVMHNRQYSKLFYVEVWKLKMERKKQKRKKH